MLILGDPVYVAEAVGNERLVADASGVCTGVDGDSVGAGLGVGSAGVSDGRVVGADKDDWTAVDRNDERGALDAFDGLLTVGGMLIGGAGAELDMRAMNIPPMAPMIATARENMPVTTMGSRFFAVRL